MIESKSIDFFASTIQRIRTERGIILDQIIPDGKYHKFKWDMEDKKPKGSYRVYHTSFGTSIYFKNFKNPDLDFSIDSEELSGPDLAMHKQRIKESQEADAKRQLIVHETVSIRAQELWKSCGESAIHPYLESKKLKGLWGCRISNVGSTLYIPAVDESGKIWSLQSIDQKGIKMNQKGGRIKGLFHVTKEPLQDGEKFYICEGFATAATLSQDLDLPAACVFSAGNFLESCKSLKLKYPKAKIVLCPDADQVGKKKGMQAARKLKLSFVVPEFKSSHPDYTDWLDLKEMEGTKAMSTQLKKASETIRSFKQDWMGKYIEERQIKFLYDGSIECNEDVFKLDVLKAQMFLDAEADGFKLPAQMLEAFVTTKMEMSKKEAWQKVANLLAQYDPKGLLEAKTFLSCIIGADKVQDPQTLAVFLHFLWQVKRKATKRHVEHHMMPVFEGPSGAGKSEAIKKLLEPLDPLHQIQSMDALTDERKFEIFQDYLVINMDEMQRAQKADLDGLKRTITSDKINHRPMRTTMSISLKNRSTIIGSTNKSLQDIIIDPTSIRRFYAFETLPLEDLKANWKTLNEIDYKLLWKAIDPSKKSPIMDFMKEVAIAQEDFRAKDCVERWAEDCELKKLQLPEDITGAMGSPELYDSYSRYCGQNGIKFVKTSDSFGRRLGSIGFKRVPNSTNPRKWYVYLHPRWR